jgi:hypothetical protein
VEALRMWRLIGGEAESEVLPITLSLFFEFGNDETSYVTEPGLRFYTESHSSHSIELDLVA